MPNGYKEDGTPTNPTGKGGFQERPWDRGKGMSSKAKESWHRAAEKAAELAELQLDAHLKEAQISMDKDDRETVIAQLTPQINALIKEATARVDGTPKQSVDLSSEDGSMSPKSAHSDAVLDALKAKHGKLDT